jgi:hypothetical protein
VPGNKGEEEAVSEQEAAPWRLTECTQSPIETRQDIHTERHADPEASSQTEDTDPAQWTRRPALAPAGSRLKPVKAGCDNPRSQQKRDPNLPQSREQNL